QLREQIDPKAQGRYTGDVNGQSAMKPGSDGRSPGEQPVERLGTPLLVAEAPHHVAWTTAASAVAYAGQNLQMTGSVIKGKLDVAGKAHHEPIPKQEVEKVVYETRSADTEDNWPDLELIANPQQGAGRG
ncbi:TPA: hypothetical protein ACGRQA_001735, partial [Stenotrophomonas maltophilia]